MNRYDEFVSSHATVCEHQTNYFAHYHRHMFVLYELALNEADKSLRDKQVPKKFDNEEYRPLFEKVFERYDEIIKGCET